MRNRKPVKQGDILIKEEPFVYVLNSKYCGRRCDYCLELYKGKLSRCAGCHYVYYCGRPCQRQAWDVHKEECKSMKRISPRTIPDAARFLARLIRKLKSGGDCVKSYYSDGSYRMFKNLMSHYSDLKEDAKRTEHFTSLCGVLLTYMDGSSMPNVSELMGIFGRMCVNSFNICDSEMNSLATGIYLAASVIDHSCKPNAIATFEGTSVVVRALEDLTHLDWQKVRISYIDVMNTIEMRRKQLKQTYYFFCECIKCNELDIPIQSYMSGAACPNPLCDACISIDRKQSPRNSACQYCPKCSIEISAEFQQEFRAVVELSEHHIKDMKDISYFDVCKFCLNRQKGVLYKFNILYVNMLDMAFHSAIQLDQFDYAYDKGYELIEAYRFYYSNMHASLGLLYLNVGKISNYKNMNKEARMYLQSAFDIIKITHGYNSNLIRKEILPLLEQLNG